MADDPEDVALFSKPQPTYTDEAGTPADENGNPDGFTSGSEHDPSPPDGDPSATEEAAQTPEEVFGQVNEKALQVCGFGRLQWMLVVVLGLAFMGDMVELMVVAFILPSAEKDLCMTDHMKGWLGSVAFAGMMVGGPVWGNLSDRAGRKTTLLAAMIIASIASVLAAFASEYWMFLVCRLLTGFGIGGSIPIVFTYMGEFCIRGRRGLYMGLMMTFWVLGGIFVSAVGWLVIPAPELAFTMGMATFVSWRVFLLICAVPVVLSVLGLLIMPESPRYLLQAGKDLEALSVYRRIYRWNHMEAGAEYEMPEIELPNGPRIKEAEDSPEGGFCSRAVRSFENFWLSFLQLFSAPLVAITFLLAIVWFASCFAYYGLTIWFPEYMKKIQQEAYFANTAIRNGSYDKERYSGLLDNIHYKDANFTNTTFSNLLLTHIKFSRCYFYDCLFENITSRKTFFVDSVIEKSYMNHTDFYAYKFKNTQTLNSTIVDTQEGCQVDFDINYSARQVYLDTLIGQVASLPTSIISALLVDRLGRVRIIGGTMLLSAVSVFFIWFINTEPAIIAMNAVFEAVFIIGWNALDILSTELYPTTLRSTGVGFLCCLARIAAILGNVTFAGLISTDKAIPVLICAVVLATGGLVSFRLPDATNKIM